MKSIILGKLKNIFSIFSEKGRGSYWIYKKNLMKSIICDFAALLILFVLISVYLIHKELKNG